MAVMPPNVLRTPLHSRIDGASAEGGIRLPGSAMTSAEEALACTCRSVGPASGVTTVPSTEPAPAMKTERRMSGRSSRSLVRPLKRTSPFSKKTARSASSSATLTDCSTTTIVVPVACSSLTTWSSCATTVGASPSESSSIMSTLGFTMSAMASDSICCSPPERLPACWWPRWRRIGNRSITRALASATAAWSLRIIQVPSRRFSSTERVGKTPRPPGMSDRPCRATASACSPVIASPSSQTAPPPTLTSPLAPFSRVDLPAPFVPSSATISPSCTSRSTPKRICTGP